MNEVIKKSVRLHISNHNTSIKMESQVPIYDLSAQLEK